MDSTEKKSFRIADYLDLALIGTTHGLSDGFSSLLVPVLALIVAELGLSASRAGLLLSIANLSAFMLIFPVSLVADHGGRRKLILLIGISVASIGFMAMRWAYGFWAIAILAFCAGAGNAVYHPCGTALAAERFTGNRAFAISFHGLMGNIGAALMPVIQAGVAVVSGWREAIFVCALPALVLLPLVAFRYRDSVRMKSRTTSRDTEKQPHPSLIGSVMTISKTVLKNKVVLLLAVVYALKGMGAKALLGFVPLYAAQELGMSTSVIGAGLTLYFGAGIAAKPLMGYLYARRGARLALSVPLLVSGSLACLIGFIPSAPVLLAALLLSGIVGPISPIILTAASDFSDRKTLASSVGFIYTCYGLGFLSPIAGGLLAEQIGLFSPFLLSGLLIWTAAALSLNLPGLPVKPQRLR